MDFLSEYILPVVLGICLCAGFVIKKWIHDVDNKWIPTIVSVLGMISSSWLHAWQITPEIILGGWISGLAATGMHELFRQFIEKD